MKRLQRKYSGALKLEMVRRVKEEGLTPLAIQRDLGIGANTVRKWLKSFESEGADAFVESPPRSGSAEELQAELLVLRLEKQQQNKEIVARALQILTEDGADDIVLRLSGWRGNRP